MPDPRTPIEPRTWLPWAAVACLAAIVAGLGELWILERMRGRVLRDEVEISQAALKSADNQIEAERIVAKSQRDQAQAASPVRVVLLAPPGGGSPDPAGPQAGAVAWSVGRDAGSLVLARGSVPPAGRAYRLWLVASDAGLDCGLVDAAAAQTEAGASVRIPAGASGRFLLILGPAGENRTFSEARTAGSIVLASLPPDGNISSLR